MTNEEILEFARENNINIINGKVVTDFPNIKVIKPQTFYSFITPTTNNTHILKIHDRYGFSLGFSDDLYQIIIDARYISKDISKNDFIVYLKLFAKLKDLNRKEEEILDMFKNESLFNIYKRQNKLKLI